MKTIVYTTIAAKQFDALPEEIREQIAAGLDRYAMTGMGDVAQLKDRPERRLRIGRYRIIFAEDAVTVLAIQIGARQTNTY